MPHSPATVANYFLKKATSDSRAITPMQLIKLVYIAHGWHLGYFNNPLINERVEAWTYGPVIRSLYGELKKYGKSGVTSPLPTPTLFSRHPKIEGETAELLDSVWRTYARFSGIELSTMTHRSGTPWDTAWNERGGKAIDCMEIPDADILAHYKEKIANIAKKKAAA